MKINKNLPIKFMKLLFGIGDRMSNAAHDREHDSPAKVFMKLLLYGFVWILFLSVIAQCHAQELDLSIIKKIESSDCVEKYGKYEHARGCWQITEPALADWNNYHPKEQYRMEQMLDDEICFKVANWYANKRIPQLMKHFKIPDTRENRIICWNAGIRYFVKDQPKGKSIPPITKEYISKYAKLTATVR